MSNKSIKQLIVKNRSYRRFYQDKPIDTSTLMEFIDLARLSASARNQQSLKYVVSNTPEQNQQIFECLAWAGYLKDWDGPAEGERPSAYLVMLNDTNIATNHYCDEGIAAQSILLGATEKGLGGCIIAAVNKNKLAQTLQLPNHLSIVQVIALGYPSEKVVLDEMEGDDYKYWRDTNDVHHVPKRKLDDLIINTQS